MLSSHNNIINEDFYKAITSAVNSDLLSDLNFSYSDENSFNCDTSGSQNFVDLSVFHLNVRSLNKNHNNLHNFLANLELSFDVIVLSEVWNHNLTLYHDLFTGYTFYHDICAHSQVGGIGVYIKNSLGCSVLDNLKLKSTENNTIENLWFEINNGNTKYILGALYRHPNQNIDEFTKLLDDNLSDISKAHVPCVIAGDINIDLSNYTLHKPTTEYVNNLLINNFLPVVVMPTRYIPTPPQLLSIIFITLKEKTVNVM